MYGYIIILFVNRGFKKGVTFSVKLKGKGLDFGVGADPM